MISAAGREFAADAVLLVEVRRAQLVQLADFRIDLDLFHDGRIAGGDGLDFGVGERAAVEVLGRSAPTSARSSPAG